MSKFLTVCVPCYNPDERLDRLIDSVINQAQPSDNRKAIEILLVDDCSTEDFWTRIKEKYGEANIKYFKTQLNGGPGPTRQRGIEHATGEWITFIDQDDEFLPDSFKAVFESIEQHPETQTMVNTPFYIIDAKTNKQTQYLPDADNWIHGKFYHVENFLRKYNIHFCEDLYSHEDIYFSTLVKGVLNCENLGYIQCNTPTYNWYTFGDSLSHRPTETGLNYLEEYYGEYIDSILEPVKTLNEKYHNQSFYSTQLLTLILFGYFYLEGFFFYNNQNYKKDNITKFVELVNYTKENLGMTTEQIILWIYNHPKVYFDIREKAAGGTGPMIESHSFATLLEQLCGDKNDQEN